MSAYTFGQLEHYWLAAGGSRALAPVMAAIAQAESSGGARPYGDVYAGTGPTSWGLWQVHTRNASSCLVNTDAGGRPYYEHALVASPLYNARAAVRIEHQQGLGAWSTYTSGAYLAYLPATTHRARVTMITEHRHHGETSNPRAFSVRAGHVAHHHHTHALAPQGPTPVVACAMIWVAAIATLVMRREIRAQRAPVRRRASMSF